MTSRLQEYLGQVPVVTLSLLAVNLSVHLVVFLSSYPINDFVFVPYFIIHDYQLYRIVTSAFLHGGLFHIAMNMMSLVGLGTMIESSYGSFRFLWITVLAVILSGTIALLFLWICAFLLNPSYLFVSSIGYSGVLFSYAVIEAYHANAESLRSVMGFFYVPIRWYPFILLLILQFILPNISFSGHLGGLIAGFVLISGAGNMLIPSKERMEAIERCLIPSSVRSWSSYHPLTSKDLRCASLGGSIGETCGSTISMLCGVVWTVFSAIMTIIGECCCHESCRGSIDTVSRFVTSFFTGYSPLSQNEEEESIEDPASRLEHGGASRLLANNNGRVLDESRSTATSSEDIPNVTMSARAMAAQAAMRRASGSSRSGSRQSSPTQSTARHGTGLHHLPNSKESAQSSTMSV